MADTVASEFVHGRSERISDRVSFVAVTNNYNPPRQIYSSFLYTDKHNSFEYASNQRSLTVG